MNSSLSHDARRVPRDAYLKGGCSKYPLDLLRDTGVEMEQPTRVDQALDQFGRMVEELDSLV